MTSAEIVKALRCGEDANGTPRAEPGDGELVCYSGLKRELRRQRKMADFITKAQYEELEDLNMCCDAEEFNKLLEKYTGIEARPYTAYQYFDRSGDYIGDSNENDVDELLQAAYVEVNDG